MVSDLLREDSLTLNADMNFREALKMVSKNPFSEYPVVSEGILVSSITLEDILFNLDNARSLKELDSEPFIAQINDSLISLVESLSEGEYDCVFVVDDVSSMRYKGFISETDIRLKLMELLNKTLT